jgi:ABC-type antimicrobial peptide transport system permease subunit
MLRALGFKEGHLMTLISIQSFMFSIPGVCCGLVVAVILNMIFRFMIYYFASNAMSFWVTSLAVIVGVIFGLVMPLIAIILPVKQALGKNLRNSLDLNHRQNNEKSVTS